MSDVAIPLEKLIREVKRSGFRVSNLCHRMDGMWQANLRSNDHHFTFAWAYGVDASNALEKALAKAKAGVEAVRQKLNDDERDPFTIGATADGLTVMEDIPEDRSIHPETRVSESEPATTTDDLDDLIG